ncbi:MAG: type II toxin-antitoxin system VapC family toxin [Anaerolineae bacterium]|jgi:predicted nucleic acid-binding protein|nr:MAG: type II toxin-antitoxin system VapC family toxin [Anaerolineae bacterium]
MTTALADTTVVIHLYRRYAPALTWDGSLSQPLSITPITWMEVMYGAGSKSGQQACEVIMQQFELIPLLPEDQNWAMQQLKTHRLSQSIAIMDCLIASVAFRLRVPFYTHNLKDMKILLGDSLPVKPYL